MSEKIIQCYITKFLIHFNTTINQSIIMPDEPADKINAVCIFRFLNFKYLSGASLNLQIQRSE